MSATSSGLSLLTRESPSAGNTQNVFESSFLFFVALLAFNSSILMTFTVDAVVWTESSSLSLAEFPSSPLTECSSSACAAADPDSDAAVDDIPPAAPTSAPTADFDDAR
jgi:hypothetical protein